MADIFRMTFWIVLLFVFFHANSYPIGEYNIDLMKKTVTCPSNATFRAPVNVKAECIIAALKSASKELEVAEQLCAYDDDENYIEGAVGMINYTLEDRTEPKINSTKCSSNNWPKTTFKVFLVKLKSLIQMDNSLNPSR